MAEPNGKGTGSGGEARKPAERKAAPRKARGKRTAKAAKVRAERPLAFEPVVDEPASDGPRSEEASRKAAPARGGEASDARADTPLDVPVARSADEGTVAKPVSRRKKAKKKDVPTERRYVIRELFD